MNFDTILIQQERKKVDTEDLLGTDFKLFRFTETPIKEKIKKRTVLIQLLITLMQLFLS